MSKVDDGGPAFPKLPTWRPGIDHAEPWDYGSDGLSIRDYFAGQALVGMMSNPMYNENTTRNIAQVAYMTADAMLKERHGAA